MSSPNKTADSYDREATESTFLPPPPSVPLGAFPPQVAALLQEASEAFTVPMQIPTACLLGMLSCLVGGTRLISLRPSWEEPGNIWIATVAASGIGKTPCATAFFKPIKALEHEAFKKWQAEYRAYEEASDIMPQPVRRQTYVDDATVEALGEVLSENPRGIMWRKDELSGLIADMDRYTKSTGSTRSRLLSSYDGQEWKTNRASTPTRNQYILHAYVGIFGGIQPAMLSKVFETGATGADEASGFLQRFMFIRAERDKPSLWTDTSLSPESLALLESVTKALWSWDIEYDENKRPIEKVVTASPQAKAIFVRWFNGIAREEFLSQNAALLSKLKGQAQRLCLLLHCLDAALDGTNGMKAVTGDTMRRALLLTNWVKEHQTQCWRFFSPGKVKQVNPIERAIMQAVVEEADRIAAEGWRISNEHLFALAEKKLDMPGLSNAKLGKAASALGLGHCSIGKGRGRTVTSEKMHEFKATVGTVGIVGIPYTARKSTVDSTVGQVSATVGSVLPALPTVTDSRPTDDHSLETIDVQGLPTLPTVPTNSA